MSDGQLLDRQETIRFDFRKHKKRPHLANPWQRDDSITVKPVECRKILDSYLEEVIHFSGDQEALENLRQIPYGVLKGGKAFFGRPIQHDADQNNGPLLNDGWFHDRAYTADNPGLKELMGSFPAR